MAGISINLLPASSRINQKVQKKFQVVQTASITVLLILVFLTSLVTALRILQSQGVSNLKQQSKLQEEKVTLLKDKEAQVAILKNRLSLINKINKGSAEDNSVVYRRVLGYIPEGVELSTISVDRGGDVVTSILAPDTKTLEIVLANLTSDEAFEGISRIDIDSLSRARDGSYRAILKIQN